MSPPNSAHIDVITPGEPLESLVDEHIVHQKISRPVEYDAKSDGLQPPHVDVGVQIHQQKDVDSTND